MIWKMVMKEPRIIHIIDNPIRPRPRAIEIWHRRYYQVPAVFFVNHESRAEALNFYKESEFQYFCLHEFDEAGKIVHMLPGYFTHVGPNDWFAIHMNLSSLLRAPCFRRPKYPFDVPLLFVGYHRRGKEEEDLVKHWDKAASWRYGAFLEAGPDSRRAPFGLAMVSRIDPLNFTFNDLVQVPNPPELKRYYGRDPPPKHLIFQTKLSAL